MNAENQIPRRNQTWLMVPAELAIHNAKLVVEDLGADIKLTEAIVLLEKARNLVGDYLDEKYP